MAERILMFLRFRICENVCQYFPQCNYLNGTVEPKFTDKEGSYRHPNVPPPHNEGECVTQLRTGMREGVGGNRDDRTYSSPHFPKGVKRERDMGETGIFTGRETKLQGSLLQISK